MLPAELTCADYSFEGEKIPALNVSASRDKSGHIHVTLCNLNPNASAEVTCELRGVKAKTVTGRVLTAPEMQAHNTFDQPETIQPSEFTAVKQSDTGFSTTLPPKSVVVLAVAE
jgi:alpha-N-arabinofuranosidase